MPSAFNPTQKPPQDNSLIAPRPRLPKPKKPKADKVELSPEEEASTLRQFGNTVLSGAASVGNLLEAGTGLASVKNILAGENPLTPFEHPFSSEGRTTGRELLTKWGLTEPNDPDKWELADVAGFATDVALDPATWVGVGLFGKAAKEVGVLGAYAKGAKAASKAAVNALPEAIGSPLESAGLKASEAVGSTVRALKRPFSRSVQGAASDLGQEEYSLGTKLTQEGSANYRMQLAPLVRQFAESEHFGKAAPEVATKNWEHVSNYLEQAGPETTIKAPNGDAIATAVDLPEHLKSFQPALDQARQLKDQAYADVAEHGLNAPQMREDYVRHFPRETVQFLKDSPGVVKPSGGGSGAAFETRTPNAKPREEYLMGHPGGTTFLNQLSLDPEISGAAYKYQNNKLTPQGLDAVRQHIRNNYVGKGLGPQTDAEADQLARWVAHLDPQHVQLNVPAFDPNFLNPLAGYLEHANVAVQGAKSAYRLIGRTASLEASPGSRTVGSIMDQLGMKRAKAADKIIPLLEANPELKEQVGKAFGSGGKLAEMKLTGEALDHIHMPGKYADDVTRVLGAMQTPSELNPILKMADKFQNLFKMAVTAFPAFHGRNVPSGQIQNFLGGVFGPMPHEIAQYVRSAVDWRNIAKGKHAQSLHEIPEFAGLSAKEATRKMQEEIFAHRVTGGGHFSVDADLGASPLADLSGEMPGIHPAPGALDILKSAVPHSWAEANPLNSRGVATRQNVFSWAKANEMLGAGGEGYNRVPAFINLRKKGWSAADAAARVKELQVDYSNLSRFEKTYMRRIAPFYAFTSQMGKYVANELWQHPAGRLRQLIRVQQLAASDDPGNPDYVQSRAAIPVGEAFGSLPEGTSRFLTGLGMMHEDVLDFAGDNPLLELASRTNPLIKGGLEKAFGESTFQRGASGGRDLSELDPTIGRTIANLTGSEHPLDTRSLDFLVGNSPLARVASTLRTATDPRKNLGAKAVNLLTGLRLSDVSPEQKQYQLADQVKQAIKAAGGRAFTDVSFRKDMELTPEQAKLSALAGVIRSRGAKMKKAKKELQTQ